MNFWHVTREAEVYLEGTLRFFQHLVDLFHSFSVSVKVTMVVAVLHNCPHKIS